MYGNFWADGTRFRVLERQFLDFRYQFYNAKRFGYNIILQSLSATRFSLQSAVRVGSRSYHACSKKRRNLLAPCVRRNRDDRDVPIQEALGFELADFTRALQAIHDRHLFVHKNNADVDGVCTMALPEP